MARGARPRTTSDHPHGKQCLAGHASHGASAGSACLHRCTHSMWAADSACLPQGRAAKGGEHLTAHTAHKGATHPPQGCPPATRTACTPACKRARCAVSAGLAYPHLPRQENKDSGRRLPPQGTGSRGRVIAHPRTPLNTIEKQEGRREDRPPFQRSTSRERQSSRKRGGALTSWKGPTSALRGILAKCARKNAGGGGKREHRRSASIQRCNGHAGPSRRTSRPSSRKAQTSWNGRRGQGTPGRGKPPQAPRGTGGKDSKGGEDENMHQPRPPDLP